MARQKRYYDPATAAANKEVEKTLLDAVTEEKVADTCATCKHWDGATGVDGVGRCRRYPPNIVSPTDLCLSGPICKFPLTRSGEVCGEHSPRLS